MAHDRGRLQPGEVRQCAACGAHIQGALTISGDVVAVSTTGIPGGRVWFGHNEAGTMICAELGGELLDLARASGFALHEFHIHPAGE